MRFAANPISARGSAAATTAAVFFIAPAARRRGPTCWWSTTRCCSPTSPCVEQTDNYSATAVLPPFDRVILDEAHHLEDVATSYFSAQTTRFTFSRVLNRLRHPRKPEQGLLPRLLDQLARELPDSADTSIAASMRRLRT
jgi:hypothetical protein